MTRKRLSNRLFAGIDGNEETALERRPRDAGGRVRHATCAACTVADGGETAGATL